MFEHLLRKMRELERAKISIPISVDDKGYYDKECPNQDCLFQFKVNSDDWKNLFSEEAVFCPKCRHEAKSDSWFTAQQIEEGKRQAIKHVRATIGKAIDEDAKNFNSSQSNRGFIKMSMQVTGHSRNYFIIPIAAQKEMQLELRCEKCTANYAVIGSAFFCPCCGYNSVERTFDDAIKKVETKIQSLSIIRRALQDAGKIDDAEITCVSLIETGLSDCVVAFQRFSEETYRKFSNSNNIPFNAFQRLDTGSDLWKKATNEGYETWLETKELSDINILFQKRHLLAHNEGIVDSKYVSKSGDSAYQVGQRIVVKEKDVQRLIYIIQKIVSNIRLKTANP